MEAETRPFVPWDLMNAFMVDVFVKYGVPEPDARICADVLLEPVKFLVTQKTACPK